jgi:hypothetical protein
MKSWVAQNQGHLSSSAWGARRLCRVSKNGGFGANTPAGSAVYQIQDATATARTAICRD